MNTTHNEAAAPNPPTKALKIGKFSRPQHRSEDSEADILLGGERIGWITASRHDFGSFMEPAYAVLEYVATLFDRDEEITVEVRRVLRGGSWQSGPRWEQVRTPAQAKREILAHVASALEAHNG